MLGATAEGGGVGIGGGVIGDGRDGGGGSFVAGAGQAVGGVVLISVRRAGAEVIFKTAVVDLIVGVAEAAYEGIRSHRGGDARTSRRRPS